MHSAKQVEGADQNDQEIKRLKEFLASQSISHRDTKYNSRSPDFVLTAATNTHENSFQQQSPPVYQ